MNADICCVCLEVEVELGYIYHREKKTLLWTMRGFQKQSTTIILDCRDGLDSETFHNDILFKTVTAAVAEIPLYYKKMCFLKIIVNVFERVHILQC